MLSGIARFGVGLAANAQLPDIGADLGIAGQADATIREGQANGTGVTEGMVRGGKRTGLAGGQGKRLVRNGQIRLRLVGAFLAAEPFGGLT